MDVSLALTYLSNAAPDPATSARERLHWINKQLLMMQREMVHKSLDQQNVLLGIYRHLINLLPQVAYFGLDVTRRLSALVDSERLGLSASVLALSLEQPASHSGGAS